MSEIKRQRSKKRPDKEQGWIDGIAYCVQVLANTFDEGEAGSLLKECGLSYNDFDQCDPYDRKQVRRIFRTEPNLAHIYEARKKP
jgi:hypothetical protein